ncbi:MAG: HesA/MoeB/ThiF family protein [Anaerolineae bacterium]
MNISDGESDALGKALNARARMVPGTDGPLRLLALGDSCAIAQELGRTRREVELAAVRARIMPARYRRSLGTVGWDGQATLLISCVAVVGCGGLGGWVVEGLARMGVGRIILVDGDQFEEDNLNRQLGCLEGTLGRPKVAVLADRVQQINGGVEVLAFDVSLDAGNGPSLLDSADVIVDALDSLPARYALQRVAREMSVPMVHGAVAGYTGQVMTIMPGDAGLARLYGEEPAMERGVETRFGNPAATPMLVAAWQLAEVIKLLIGETSLIRDRMLFLDTLYGDASAVSWATDTGE